MTKKKIITILNCFWLNSKQIVSLKRIIFVFIKEANKAKKLELKCKNKIINKNSNPFFGNLIIFLKKQEMLN